MNGGWAPGVRCVQPGEGRLVAAARWVGRMRRAWLRRLRPAYVARRQAQREAGCPDCRHDVIDGRDLVWVRNVCAVRFAAAATVSPFGDRLGLVRLGRPELVASALLTAGLVALAGVLTWWLLPLAVAPLAFAVWFFRDPQRRTPRVANAVLAPADGVLDDVRHEVQCPFFDGPALRLGIYLSLFDVHVQRAPCAGVVTRCEHRPGRHVPTVRRGVTDGNEQLLTWFADAAGRPCVVRQVAGPVARRICSVLAVGEVVAAGQRFGLIKFGSRVELWLPAARNLELVARRGQRVRGGESVLARRTAAELPAADAAIVARG